MPDPTQRRFEVVRELGRGGMGVVQLVRDAEWDAVVAQKRILFDDPQYLLRFKREFRAIEQLEHPNLVRLYELGEDDEGIYFTMEALRGTDLATWCLDSSFALPTADTSLTPPVRENSADMLAFAETGHPPAVGTGNLVFAGTLEFDSSAVAERTTPTHVRADVVAKVRHALVQVTRALEYLHASAIVHRDLKPPNVLVTDEGEVKLLDFGIAGRVGHGSILDRPEAPVGTVGYMAPEQIRGESPTPQSDMYAVGALLYELLTARPVFTGPSPLAVMIRHMQDPVPDPRSAVDGIPEGWSELCIALLAKDPLARPSLADVRRVLAGEASYGPVASGGGEILGRESLRGRLESLLDEGARPRAVVLQGSAGVGKTALVEALAVKARSDGWKVLHGGGRSRDRVAFNAVDPLIDELALELSGKPPMPESITAAAAFPALSATRAQNVARASVFDAVVRLLDALGEGAPGVMLVVDDLQWADADSLALLSHILGSESQLVMVGCSRDDAGTSRVERWAAPLPNVSQLLVGPLGDDVIAELVERSGGVPSPQAVARCAGSPLLAELIASLGEDRLERDVLRQFLDRQLEPADRELLPVIVAADDWSSSQDVAALLGLAVGTVEPRLIRLDKLRILRVGTIEGSMAVDVCHGALREALERWLGADALRSAHERHATWLESREAPRAQRIARHFSAAQMPARAARWARAAAVDAENQLAWSHAADMWQLVGGEDPEGLRRRAQNLERAGRYREAAQTWEAVAEIESGPRERRDALVWRGVSLLASNRIDDGYAAVESALKSDGGFGTRLAELGALARFAAGPSMDTARAVARDAREPDPQSDNEMRGELRTAMIVSFFDAARGLYLIMRLREELIAARAADQLAWCDYLLSFLAHHRSSSRDTPALARRYLASATAAMGDRPPPTPQHRAWPQIIEAIDVFRRGRLAEALELVDEARGQLDAMGFAGTFEYMYLLAVQARWTIVRQDIALMEHVTARFEQLARSEDFAVAAHLRIVQTFLHLYRGELDSARDVSERFDATVARPTIHKVLNRALGQMPGLWDGRIEEAHAAVRRALEDGKRFRITETLFSGVFLGFAALVEAQALRAELRGSDAKLALRLAAAADEAPPTLVGWSSRARAYVASARGDARGAIEELRAAAQRSEALGQALDVQIARFQLGLRLPGAEGAALCASAREAMRKAGGGLRLLEEDIALR